MPIGCTFKERGELAVNFRKESINFPWLFTQPMSLKNIANLQKSCPEHISSYCWVVKGFNPKYFAQFEFCHNLSFVTIWVLSLFWCLSQFEFSQFELCHNLSFVIIWVLSQFEFSHTLVLIPILVFSHLWFYPNLDLSHLEFCHNFSFFTTLVLLQL